jgi:hypothetical protein
MAVDYETIQLDSFFLSVVISSFQEIRSETNLVFAFIRSGFGNSNRPNYQPLQK